MLSELKDELAWKKQEVEYFKNELLKERCANAKVYESLILNQVFIPNLFSNVLFLSLDMPIVLINQVSNDSVG